MGANVFFKVSSGKNANEAFNNAVQQAQYDYGHRGYSGSIAEKRSFVVIQPPEGEKPREFADKLIDGCDPRVDDKWGPAGCIPMGEDKFLFFGWASS